MPLLLSRWLSRYRPRPAAPVPFHLVFCPFPFAQKGVDEGQGGDGHGAERARGEGATHRAPAPPPLPRCSVGPEHLAHLQTGGWLAGSFKTQRPVNTPPQHSTFSLHLLPQFATGAVPTASPGPLGVPHWPPGKPRELRTHGGTPHGPASGSKHGGGPSLDEAPRMKSNGKQRRPELAGSQTDRRTQAREGEAEEGEEEEE